MGVVSHELNLHDSHTLPEILRHIEVSRGKSNVNKTQVILPKKPLKRDTCYQRGIKRKQCRRHAAIEPIIGHLKSDYKLIRNYLKGVIGVHINLLMAACTWNLKKWLLAIFWFLFPPENVAMTDVKQ